MCMWLPLTWDRSRALCQFLVILTSSFAWLQKDKVIKNCRLERPNSDCSYEAYVYFLSSRVPVAKLGASADPLRIEAGRYALPTPLPVEERTTGVVPTRLRMYPSHVNLPKQQWTSYVIWSLFNNPAFSNMTSTDRMVFTIIYTNVLKSLGHHVFIMLWMSVIMRTSVICMLLLYSDYCPSWPQRLYSKSVWWCHHYCASQDVIMQSCIPW